MIIGLVGKPSAGKSTFLKAATLAEVEIASYPFTTIKPNHAIGFVKINCVDKEFGKQCNPREGYCLQGWRFVPIQLVDVAGLVPDAHKGAGMGLQFLDDLRQADLLIHVVDISGGTNEKGETVTAGSHNPAGDIIFLEEELDMWYLDIITKGWERFARQVQQEHGNISKALGKQLSGLKVTEEIVEEAVEKLSLDRENPIKWGDAELKHLATELRKKTKPMIIACNKIDVATGEENYKRLQKEYPDRMLIPCSAESEVALRQAAKAGLVNYTPGEATFTLNAPEKLNANQKKALEFIQKNILDKWQSTGIQPALDRAVFDFLGYIAIFPGGVNNLVDKHGNVLPDCFLLPPKSTPVDFAFKIHTDIGNKYVKAINVKTKLPMSKDHLLQHRDVVEIKTSS